MWICESVCQLSFYLPIITYYYLSTYPFNDFNQVTVIFLPPGGQKVFPVFLSISPSMPRFQGHIDQPFRELWDLKVFLMTGSKVASVASVIFSEKLFWKPKGWVALLRFIRLESMVSSLQASKRHKSVIFVDVWSLDKIWQCVCRQLSNLSRMACSWN